MIEKSLSNLFGIVTAEAGRNRVFAQNLEDAIIKLGADLGKQRELEETARAFNPFVVYKTGGPEALAEALKPLPLKVLKLTVERHNIDPTGALPVRSRKPERSAAIMAAAEKRASRDSRLFEY